MKRTTIQTSIVILAAAMICGYATGAAGQGAPEIQGNTQMLVGGNGRVISPGDDTPRLEDGTYFGGANVEGQALSSVFAIQNLSADQELVITDITLTGDEPQSFFLGSKLNFPLVIPPGKQMGVQVVFDPAAQGERRAAMSIATAAGAYPFVIGGQGVASGEEPLVYVEDFDGKQVLPGMADAAALAYGEDGVPVYGPDGAVQLASLSDSLWSNFLALHSASLRGTSGGFPSVGGGGDTGAADRRDDDEGVPDSDSPTPFSP